MSDTSASGGSLFDRTMANFRRAWRDFARLDRGDQLAGRLRADFPDAEQDLVRRQIDICLRGRGGEVSARARAADLGRAYLGLDSRGRHRFLGLLAREYGAHPEAIDAAMGKVRAASDETGRRQAERGLREALISPRTRLFTQFNGLPEGIHFLVELRADLLSLQKEGSEFAVMDQDLKDLLVSWFDVGFLNLQRIHWRSSAALLEKLMAYEAVHEIRSWQDLKNRLDSDRRCFAFFHPRMPDEPLIFVEVALVNGIVGNIHELLDEKAPAIDPRQADTAIFYSISNCQKGLAGVSFGDFLIKRVVDDLAGHFPNLKQFATLSPIPGFTGWLKTAVGRDDPVQSKSETAALQAALPAGSDGGLAAVLANPGMLLDAPLAAALQEPLMRLCASYLATEKRPDGAALDRVAHFHLSNGARIERINWLGNLSAAGLEQACGMMVNYRYKLDEIEDNHEQYRGEGRIASAQGVRRLAKI